jgi:hypothetical protein
MGHYLWNLYTSIHKNHPQPKGCHLNFKFRYLNTLIGINANTTHNHAFFILILFKFVVVERCRQLCSSSIVGEFLQV